MSIDESRLREAYDSLHASAKTRQEVMNMHQEDYKSRRIGRSVLSAAICAVLVLALAVGVMAAAGVFRVDTREAEPGERFRLTFVTEEELYWNDAKLVLQFDGPDVCNTIRFKPGWLPSEPWAWGNICDSDGYYQRLTGENSEEDIIPYQICLYYASKYTDGGHLILLHDEPVGEIEHAKLGEYEVLKIHTQTHNPNFPNGEYDYDSYYYLMYHPVLGHIIRIAGRETDFETLEHIARELEIDVTDDVISASDYPGYNEFFDVAFG